MRRAIFLDRDGTINAKVHRAGLSVGDSPWSPDEFELLPGVGEAIRRVNVAGMLTVIASNQPGIAKGQFTIEALDAITSRMHQELAKSGARVDAVLYCIHHPEAVLKQYRTDCSCRKPKPGLLEEGARSFGIDLRASFMVGDGLKDVQAGSAAGCRVAWLGGRRSSTRGELREEGVRPDWVATDLLEAIDLIMKTKET